MKQQQSGRPFACLLAILAAFAALVPAAAQATTAPPQILPGLTSLLPASTYAELMKSGSIVQTAPEGQGPVLLPAHAASASIRSALASEKPNLIVEALYLYHRPRPADPQAELRSLYGTLLSISSLEGIQYWSASRQKMRTFYAESYRIDGPKSKRRLPDLAAPAAGPLPSAATCYAFQRDLTFGPNVYRYDYAVSPEAILLESTNMTSMTYLALPLMAPGGLKVRLLVIQTDEALLFYVASGANAPSLGIIRDKVEESITNRAVALCKWFEGKQKR
jgi:hypothetical protein